MFYYNKLSVAAKSTPAVNNFARSGCNHRLPLTSSKINTRFSGLCEISQHPSIGGPRPPFKQRCRCSARRLGSGLPARFLGHTLSTLANVCDAFRYRPYRCLERQSLPWVNDVGSTNAVPLPQSAEIEAVAPGDGIQGLAVTHGVYRARRDRSLGWSRRRTWRHFSDTCRSRSGICARFGCPTNRRLDPGSSAARE